MSEALATDGPQTVKLEPWACRSISHAAGICPRGSELENQKDDSHVQDGSEAIGSCVHAFAEHEEHEAIRLGPAALLLSHEPVAEDVFAKPLVARLMRVPSPADTSMSWVRKAGNGCKGGLQRRRAAGTRTGCTAARAWRTSCVVNRPRSTCPLPRELLCMYNVHTYHSGTIVGT